MLSTTHDEVPMTELQSFLVHAVKRFASRSLLGRLKDIDGSHMWDQPLVGFAEGDDRLFTGFRTVVGEFHMTPREVLTAHGKVPGGTAPHHLSKIAVISWVLPIVEATKQSNREMSEGPSLRWNHTRFQGEDFNDSLRRHVVRLLEERGYVAVAPVLSSGFATHRLSNGPASTWSERHIAYAAGLGTFSLSDGLITAKGIAHRCGSVVFNAACIATRRPYKHHQEYCLYASNGSCGECIARCPAGAITTDGHDKLKCEAYLMNGLAEWKKKPGYIGSYVACGLCQTGVPCESCIPAS